MSDKTAENLTLRQRRAVEALLSQPDITAAAHLAGVSRDTIYRWLKQPAFQQALTAAQDAALAELTRGLLALGRQALAALEDALSAGVSPSLRLRAAGVVLEHLLKLRELVDLEQRVSALENLLTGGDKND